jgi:hypothetical protein
MFVIGAPGVAKQLSLRVELLEHGVEVALIHAAAMEQDQRALGFAGRLAIEVIQLDEEPGPIGSTNRVALSRTLASRRGHVGC